MSRGYRHAYQGGWMGQVRPTSADCHFPWTYDHTVRHMQHLSMRDQLDPHLQIDPFPGREQDYPLYGYYGHLPPNYDYRQGPPPSDHLH